MADNLHQALQNLHALYSEEAQLTGQRPFNTHLSDGTDIEAYIRPRPPHDLLIAVRFPDETEVVDLTLNKNDDSIMFSMRENDTEDVRHRGPVHEDGTLSLYPKDDLTSSETHVPHPELLSALQTRLDRAASEVITHSNRLQALQEEITQMIADLPGVDENIGELIASQRNDDLAAIPVNEQNPEDIESALKSRLDILSKIKELRAELANQDQVAADTAILIQKRPELADHIGAPAPELSSLQKRQNQDVPLSQFKTMTAEEFLDGTDPLGGDWEVLVAPYDTQEVLTQRVIRTDQRVKDEPVVVLRPGLPEGTAPDAGSQSDFRPVNFMCVIVPYINDITPELLTKITNVRATFFNVYNFTGGRKGNLITEIRQDGPEQTVKANQDSFRNSESKVQELAAEIATQIPGMTGEEVLRRVDTINRQEKDELGNLGL